MLQTATEFQPFRLKLSRRMPVKLKLILKNIGKRPELVSFDMLLPGTLSFDKGGFRATHSKRLGEMQPGQEYEEYLEIHPRPTIQEGIQSILLKTTEHYKNYDFIKQESKKRLELVTEE